MVATCWCTAGYAVTNFVSTAGGIFEPSALTINVGDTIVWIQEDVTEHTVTSDDLLFGSPTLNFDERFSYTFDSPGFYRYYCTFHGGIGGAGMSGVVTVSEPGDNLPPDTPINQSPPNNATNQPVAGQLRASAFSDPDAIDFHRASQWILRYATNAALALDSGEVTAAGMLTTYHPTGLLEGASYDWQVRYKDGRGAWSLYSAPTRFTTLVSFNQPGVGLLASYNNIADFTSPLAVVTNATINFNWGSARPHRRITADAFAVRWEGSLLPRFTEQYQVQFQYHGRARVWVNNQLLIDEWNACSFSQTRRGAVSLVGGQLAAVRVEYAADPAGALAILRWASPSLPLEVIPTTRLFPQPP
jgi:plastocyanin